MNIESITVPVPYAGNITNEPHLNDLRNRGFLAGISYYPNLAVYRRGAATIPLEGPKPKYFSTNQVYGVFIDGPLRLTAPGAFSDSTWRLYSPTMATFYRERSMLVNGKPVDTNFFNIPKLVIRKIDNPSMLNFSQDANKDPDIWANGRIITDSEQEVPLGILIPYESGAIDVEGTRYVCTFPSNHGLMYVNGLPRAFHYEVYNRVNPIKTLVYTGDVPTPGVGTIVARNNNNQAVIDAAIMAVTGPFTASEKVAKIITTLEVK